MSAKPLRTIDVARRAGIAVNTVRQYEEFGYLPPVPRGANGYRLFDDRHVQHALMVRQAVQITWVGGKIRQTALDVLIIAAQGDYPSALANADILLDLLHTEKDHAEEAIRVLETWASSVNRPKTRLSLSIGKVAERLHVSIDELRSWERNGLLTVPRAANGYRRYGQDEWDRPLVIRALRRARYSSMAILRLLQSFDAGDVAHLREVLDTPPPDFDSETYPTDSWISTLERMQHSAETLREILAGLANPP